MGALKQKVAVWILGNLGSKNAHYLMFCQKCEHKGDGVLKGNILSLMFGNSEESQKPSRQVATKTMQVALIPAIMAPVMLHMINCISQRTYPHASL